MSATTSGVRDEMREQQSRLLRIKLATATKRVKAGDRLDLEGQLDKAAQAFMDGLPFKVEWLAPKNFGQLLFLVFPPGDIGGKTDAILIGAVSVGKKSGRITNPDGGSGFVGNAKLVVHGEFLPWVQRGHFLPIGPDSG